jgi:hypothetical protein
MNEDYEKVGNNNSMDRITKITAESWIKDDQSLISE